MTPKDLLDSLEMQMKNMEYRELIPEPESNKVINQLI